MKRYSEALTPKMVRSEVQVVTRKRRRFKTQGLIAHVSLLNSEIGETSIAADFTAMTFHEPFVKATLDCDLLQYSEESIISSLKYEHTCHVKEKLRKNTTSPRSLEHIRQFDKCIVGKLV